MRSYILAYIVQEIKMSRLTRTARSENDLNLHYYSSHTPSSPTTPSLFSAPVYPSETLDVSIIIFRAGFITSIGCICCIPTRYKGTVTLMIHIDRLKIISKILSAPLKTLEINKFLKFCQKTNDKSDSWYVVAPDFIKQQFSKVSISSEEDVAFRQNFLTKFKKHRKLQNNYPSCLEDCWGYAVPREYICDELLEQFCKLIQRPYKAAVEWTLGWKCLMNVDLKDKKMLEFDEMWSQNNKMQKLGDEIFLKETQIPGPPLDLNMRDNPCSHLKEGIIALIKNQTVDPQIRQEISNILSIDRRVIRFSKDLLNDHESFRSELTHVNA